MNKKLFHPAKKAIVKVAPEAQSEDELQNAMRALMKKFLHEVYKQQRLIKLNRTQLAELMGVSPGYLSQVFGGQKALTFVLIAKFEKALNIEFLITAVSLE